MANPGETTGSTMGYGNSGANAERVKDAAGNAFDKGRDAATDTLKSAADYIGDKVGQMPGAETVQRTAAAAADSVSAGADYLTTTDTNQMVADVEALVKRNPGPALLGAAVLGFLIGRSLSR